MSAYTEQQTMITDADLLVDCLKEKGMKEVQKHDKPVQLEGYHGDKRKDTAEIVIPRRAVGSSSNDIGFKKQEDGTYKAIISQYDTGRYGANWMKDLKTLYAKKKIQKVASQQGMTLLGTKTLANGSTQLQFIKA